MNRARLPQHVLVAICGASGTRYGLRLVEQLALSGAAVSVVISESGRLVCREETGLDLSGDPVKAQGELCAYLALAEEITLVPPDDLSAAAASGSAPPDAMVVAPCSMGTLARIASGISGNLIERAADVMLKERRPLLLVPRETPLSEIHLENMLRVTRCGALLIPAMPAFYHHPRTIEDMVDFVVGRVLDQLGIEHSLYRRWGS